MRVFCENERQHDSHGNCPGRGTRLTRCPCGGIAAITHPDGRVEGTPHDCKRTGAIRASVEEHRSLLDRLS